MSYDLVIKNGMVVDGSGLPKAAADETPAGDRWAPQARSRP